MELENRTVCSYKERFAPMEEERIRKENTEAAIDCNGSFGTLASRKEEKIRLLSLLNRRPLNLVYSSSKFSV